MASLAPDEIAVVVLTRNRVGLVAGVLKELEGWTDVGLVIVIDNASEDATSAHVREVHPHFRLICSENNVGATGGRNLGLRTAEAEGYRFAYLIEDDTTPDRTAFEAAREMLEVHEEAALVGASGGVFRFGRIKWLVTAGTTESRVRRTRYDFVHLDNCLVRLRALREVGWIRDDFFIMMEEPELGWRLRQSGWEVRCCGVSTERLTVGAQSSTRARPWRSYYQTRNHLAMVLQFRSLSLAFGFGSRLAHQFVVETIGRNWTALRWRILGIADAARGNMGQSEIVTP